jgi:hypothetical protein
MKRFRGVAVLTAVLVLGSVNVASAQWVVQSGGVTPYGAVVTNRQVYNWGNVRSYNTYVSPWGTVKKQSLYTDVWGNSFGRTAGFNPFLGVGYNKTFVQSNPLFVTPNPVLVAPNPRWISPGWVRRW